MKNRFLANDSGHLDEMALYERIRAYAFAFDRIPLGTVKDLHPL